ncbi:hypothetical protein F2P81_005998 [Scophthalmus maximus]|uniref:TGF-beta family profile domain-containing protein n=1 Tax=Scophthalmus maximus TaxID=52904 RepID=A0A6A4T4K4_SCOMX|nr:hypothetical protein F2P81_005998 [Scophthalmus maximus]
MTTAQEGPRFALHPHVHDRAGKDPRQRYDAYLCHALLSSSSLTLLQATAISKHIVINTYRWKNLVEAGGVDNPASPEELEGEWSLIQEEEIHQGRWRRSSRDPNPTRTSRRNRKKTKSTRDCHLERKEMRVRDLGLGYDSDEIVLFKYCVGTCHSSRRNYDLALKTLMDTGSISTKKVSSHPCCRPTRYETVSFMDTQTTWQTIKWLSAANCSCLG